MNRKIFYILAAFSIVIISMSSILLITKNVIGFDTVGFAERNCVPHNIIIERGEKDYSVNISWSTKAECVGFVQYGRDMGNLDMVLVDLVNKSKSKNHSVVVEKLLSEEVYYFLINSDEQAYGKNGVPLEFVLGNL